ncbi:MAG: DUF1104 domain-containing protein [Sulfurospirillum sp.]|nr:DUF1104 domain-containing protein [Sulfurospirillum sp.]
MRKIFVLVLFVVALFAKSDFQAMSTQELLAMMGYVAPSAQKDLAYELQMREPKMSVQEKKTYEENLKKIKNSKQ